MFTIIVIVIAVVILLLQTNFAQVAVTFYRKYLKYYESHHQYKQIYIPDFSTGNRYCKQLYIYIIPMTLVLDSKM